MPDRQPPAPPPGTAPRQGDEGWEVAPNPDAPEAQAAQQPGGGGSPATGADAPPPDQAPRSTTG